MPLVSVVIPSFNHGRFVRLAAESALNQTFGDLEVVVVDDGSRDNSLSELQAIQDPRLRLIVFPTNRGAVEATNTGIQQSSGPLVAILNSDDVWKPNKIDQQIKAMTHESVGAVFTWAELVDEQGAAVEHGRSKLERVFEQPNRTRPQWLRSFFFDGNSLCHPSALIRRCVYEQVGLYDERFRQLPDFEMWLRLCKTWDIHIVPEKLVQFRILEGDRNTGSTRNRANSVRIAVETMLLAGEFFSGVDLATFIEGFLDECIADSVDSESQAQIEQAFLLASTDTRVGHCYRAVGLRNLFHLLREPEAAALLQKRYGFGPREFHDLLSRNDLFALNP